MRVQPISGRYTPYIQAAIERAMRECLQDAAMRAADPDTPYKLIPDHLLDLTGDRQEWIVTGASFDFALETLMLSGALLNERDRRKNA